MTTGKLEILERGAYRARMLTYALRYLEENVEVIRTSFDEAKAKGEGPPVSDFREFRRQALQSVVYGSLALFWAAFATYRIAIFGRTNGLEEVRDRCPDFRARCHRDHSEVHVLDILKDVRDRDQHGLPAYNAISCDRSPDEIMLQPIAVREYAGGREILLFGGMNAEEQLAWLKARPPTRHLTYETLGEFLLDEAIECVRAFDAITTNTGTRIKGLKLPRKTPSEFPSSC